MGRVGFVDRVDELGALEEAWRLRPALVVVYGRRRVGKTALVSEWARRMRGRATLVYYHATMASHEVKLGLWRSRLGCVASRSPLPLARRAPRGSKLSSR